MFNLGVDFPREEKEGEDEADEAEEAIRRKRKRGKRGKQEGGTGAGSKIPDEEREVGVGRKMRKVTGEGDVRVVDLDKAVRTEKVVIDSESSNDEDGDEGLSQLLELRRAEAVTDEKEKEKEKGEEVNTIRNGDLATREPEPQLEKEKEKGLPYWGTYKYRSILGIVPLGGSDPDTEEQAESSENEEERGKDGEGRSTGIEVAIVERPLFEVDLPPRYYGDQEWAEKKG